MAAQLKTPKSPINGESAKTLADILATLGALDEEKAKQVKLTEIQTGKTQEEIIISQNLVNEKLLTQAK
jgi:hypothetical protein